YFTNSWVTLPRAAAAGNRCIRTPSQVYKNKLQTMPPLKLTIISIYYPPEQGAAPSRIANLAKGLRDRHIEVDVITALPNYPTGRIFAGYRQKFSYSEVIDGIPVLRYWL